MQEQWNTDSHIQGNFHTRFHLYMEEAKRRRGGDVEVERKGKEIWLIDKGKTKSSLRCTEYGPTPYPKVVRSHYINQTGVGRLKSSDK